MKDFFHWRGANPLSILAQPPFHCLCVPLRAVAPLRTKAQHPRDTGRIGMPAVKNHADVIAHHRGNDVRENSRQPAGRPRSTSAAWVAEKSLPCRCALECRTDKLRRELNSLAGQSRKAGRP